MELIMLSRKTPLKDLVSVILLVILCLVPMKKAEGQVNWNNRLSFEPFAIFNNKISECKIKIALRGFNLTTLSVNLKSNNNITFTASGYESPQTSFPLFDDGTHGDEVAHDNIYSIGEIKTDFSIIDPKGYERVWTELVVDDSAITLWFPAFYVVQQEDFNINLLDNNTLYSDYAICFFKLVDRENITNIINNFYNKFPDLYDFILLYREKVPNWGGAFLPVKNDIKGVGIDLFDNTNEYGSSGQLQGILLFATKDVQLSAEINPTVMHEFGHRWGAYLSNPLLQLSDGVHWKNNTTIIGMMNLCCYPFFYNEDGTFTHYCSFHFNRFAPLELYTMGALSKEELDTSVLYILNDANISSELNDQIPCDSAITPEEFVKVTSNNIIEIYGEREPNYYNSQKNFKTATILVTERQPTDEEMCVWNKILRHYSEPYNESDLDGYEWDFIPSFANYSLGRLSNDFFIDMPSSIEDRIINSKISLYPNPVNSIGTFTYSIGRTVQIEIYNVSGMLIKILNDSDHNGETQVNFNDLNQGFYIYRLIDSDGIVYSGKVMRE
jgi:hypothetical protein